MNRKAFDRINYGLFLVGAALDGRFQGCVVNSLHQVTSTNPIKFSLTLSKSNETFKAVEAAGSFAATVLSKDTPKERIDLFGYKACRWRPTGRATPISGTMPCPGSAAGSWRSWIWGTICSTSRR